MSGCGQMNQEDVPYSIQKEFAIIDYLEGSYFKTKGVDAFSLSLLKMERQMRRLFTYLVFQSDAFQPCHVKLLRNSLAENRRLYFDHFLNGVDELLKGSGLSVESLVGDEFSTLRKDIDEMRGYRNKIFHGQLTDKFLEGCELLDLVKKLKKWCVCLCRGADDKLGYDGFGYIGNMRKSSFSKAENGKLPETVKRTINEKFGGEDAINKYKIFLNELARSARNDNS